MRQIFEILIIHKTLRGVTGGPTKDLGPVGSAVLICIDTNRQTSVYIEIYNLLIKNIKVLIINIFFTYYRNILFREIILLKIHKFFSSKLFNFIPASFIVLKLQLDIFLYN